MDTFLQLVMNMSKVFSIIIQQIFRNGKLLAVMEVFMVIRRTNAKSGSHLMDPPPASSKQLLREMVEQELTSEIVGTIVL